MGLNEDLKAINRLNRLADNAQEEEKEKIKALREKNNQRWIFYRRSC